MKKRDFPTGKARVFLIDGDSLMRRCLAKLLSLEPDLEVCGEAADVEQALKRIARARPDVAVVNVESTQKRGPEAISGLRWAFPKLPLLTLSMRDAAVHGRRMLQAGAVAHVDQADAARQVVPALRGILGDGSRRRRSKDRA